MPTAVITGAASGIGHAFTHILIVEGYTVHACDIHPIPSLPSPPSSSPNATITTHTLDVSSPPSIAALATALGPQPIHLLLNIAGIMAPPEADALRTTDLSVLEHAFAVNAAGPLLLTQALLPNLLAAVRGGDPPPKVGMMSSRVGSMADNRSGGSYAYRASKAALNSVSKSLAVELRAEGVAVVVMHPGYVKTGLAPASSHALPEAVEPEEAARKLWGVLRSKGLEDSGRFWHREGMELPW